VLLLASLKLSTIREAQHISDSRLAGECENQVKNEEEEAASAVVAAISAITTSSILTLEDSAGQER
jgi:hypothetical protein